MPSMWNKINAFYMPTDIKHLDVSVRPETKKTMSRVQAAIDWTSYSWPTDYREISIDNAKERNWRIEKKRPCQRTNRYAPMPLHLIIKALVLSVLFPLAPILSIPRFLSLISAKQRAKVNCLAHNFAFSKLDRKYTQLSEANFYYRKYENTFTVGFRLHPEVARGMPKQTLKLNRKGITEWVAQVRAYKDSKTDKGIAFSKNVQDQLEAIAKKAEAKIEIIEKASQKHEEKLAQLKTKRQTAYEKRQKAVMHFANLWAPQKAK